MKTMEFQQSIAAFHPAVSNHQAMTFDLQQILASKRAFRHSPATCDIVEKPAMFDETRVRAITLRAAREASRNSSLLREESAIYRAESITPRCSWSFIGSTGTSIATTDAQMRTGSGDSI